MPLNSAHESAFSSGPLRVFVVTTVDSAAPRPALIPTIGVRVPIVDIQSMPNFVGIRQLMPHRTVSV
ncbi:hypothetical protein B0O99DRAFT_637343, partial [Bisporella sp. PMI_857]